MIEFLMSKKCDLFGVVLYLFGSSSFKGYTLLCVAGSTLNVTYNKKG